MRGHEFISLFLKMQPPKLVQRPEASLFFGLKDSARRSSSFETIITSDLSLLGDVILQERLGFARLSVVLDDSAGALDNLLGLSFAVELAEAYPLAQLLAFGHAEDWDGMLFGECLYQADILSRVAVLRQDAQVRLPNDINKQIQTLQ